MMTNSSTWDLDTLVNSQFAENVPPHLAEADEVRSQGIA
jgi:hypothetical protein